MSGKSSKKIRAAVKKVAVSENAIEATVDGTRELSQTSMKFLAGQMKSVYKHLPADDRGDFFPIMQADVERLVQKYQT